MLTGRTLVRLLALRSAIHAHRRVNALYSTRLSLNLQTLVAAISDPWSNTLATERMRGVNILASNVMLSLQHDTGRTCSEYTWSTEDGMLGVWMNAGGGNLPVSR